MDRNQAMGDAQGWESIDDGELWRLGDQKMQEQWSNGREDTEAGR
jgi:hypothetical protein